MMTCGVSLEPIIKLKPGWFASAALPVGELIAWTPLENEFKVLRLPKKNCTPYWRVLLSVTSAMVISTATCAWGRSS